MFISEDVEIMEDELSVPEVVGFSANFTREKLAEGECFLQYIKMGGTLKTTTGTTNNDLIPEDSRASGVNPKKKGPTDLISYYDTALQGWRSFFPNRLERIFLIP